ncbi:MAG: 30S ribosomal protein S16 [Patescibacteria group bacterium]
MLKVKLFQRGKKHQRSYRVVIAEARSKRDGKFSDDLGSWNPQSKELKLDKKKLNSWIAKGAQLTEGVRKILTTK